MSDDREWLEVAIETNGELAEAISEAIYPYVEGGVATEQLNTSDRAAERWEDETATGPVVVRGYLPMDGTISERKEKVEYALRCLNLVLPLPMPTYRAVAQSDWAEAWKVAFKPLRIGRHILIRPTWTEVDPQPGDVVITLDPGLAFGTGLHPTTQMCIMAMEELVTPGSRVLDVGSGSALLSILAAKLGAKEVCGVDTDMEAVRVGRENVAKNNVDDVVKIEFGSFDRGMGHYDVVMVNILAGVITRMLGNGLATMGDTFVFSGILENQSETLITSLSHAGVYPIDRKQVTDWVCLICKSGYLPDSDR